LGRLSWPILLILRGKLSSIKRYLYGPNIQNRISPTAWIYAQFAMANMGKFPFTFAKTPCFNNPLASAVLVSSNLTNLVIAGAFSFSFLTYTSSVILPFLAAAAAVYPFLLFVVFRRPRKLIPHTIEAPSDTEGFRDPSTVLVDRTGAIFGAVLLIITLAVLVGTSTIGVPVWQVTVPPALLVLVRDAGHDWRRRLRKKVERGCPAVDGPLPLDDIVPGVPDAIEPELTTLSGVQTPDQYKLKPTDAGSDEIAEFKATESGGGGTQPKVSTPARSASPPPVRLSLVSSFATYYTRFKHTFPTVHIVAQRLPLPLVPFVLLMFVLVQGLAAQGWVDVFATWWGAWARATGLTGAVLGMAFLSGLLCNVSIHLSHLSRLARDARAQVCGTNIGTAILLARTLQLWEVTSPPRREVYGARFALALGANYGACTLACAASLAGLLWRAILAQKGVRVRRAEFARLNIGTWALATAVSGGVLIAQSIIVHPPG
jgi:Na+/H+ antiporter NhaD/arsenite permease-like protein